MHRESSARLLGILCRAAPQWWARSRGIAAVGGPPGTSAGGSPRIARSRRHPGCVAVSQRPGRHPVSPEALQLP